MKKLLGLVLFSITALLLGACAQLSAAQFSLATDEDIFSYQAMTTSSFLGHQASNEVLNKHQTNNILLSTTSNEEVETQDLENQDPKTEGPVELVEKYLGTVEKFISGNNGLNVEKSASDLESYEFKIVFQALDILNKTTTYTLYYNQVLTQEDLEDEEQEFVITGILMYNDLTLEVYGEKEIEADEQTLEFTSYTDALNYVTSEYTIEDDKTEFSVKEVRNGEVYSESEIEIKIEKNKIEVELEYLFEGNTYEYEFKYEGKNKTPILEIKYQTEIDGVKQDGVVEVMIIIDEVTLETIYKFSIDENSNGEFDYEYESKRDDDSDDDDEDDDLDD